MKDNKRNISIQLIRIVAMFMIILDHILGNISFPMQSMIVQVMNSGVLIFLFISGLLYGNKQIINWKNWFVSRIFRICIPLWIFMAFDFAVEAMIWNIFDIKHVFIYLFNVQGILGVNIGGSTLWFLTLIMICYIITPILQWIRSKNISKKLVLLCIVATIILQFVLAYITDAGMVADHTLSWCVIAIGMYVVGYFAGNIILSNRIGGKRIGILTIITAISSLIVLLCNQKFDGQVIYDRIIVFYGMVIIDLWICTVLYKLGQYIKDGVLTKIINHFDTISYEFYIVHGLIIAIFAQSLIGKIGVIGYILVIIVLSYVAAWVLHGICNCIYKMIK